MKLFYTEKFMEKYERTTIRIQRAMKKQATLLKQDLRHPSLRAKKYDESLGIWQARVTKGWRFYFTINGDTYRLHDIRQHPK